MGASGKPDERRRVLIGVALGCLGVLILGAIAASVVGVFMHLEAGEAEEGVPLTTPSQEQGHVAAREAGQVAAQEVASADAGAAGEPVEARVAPGKTVKPKTDTGKGELDEGEIKKVIMKSMGRFKRCYDNELHASPTLRGKVVVKLVIGQSGKVTKAAIASSSLGSKKVESCVLETASNLVFPKPEGGSVAVSYPFVFAPAG